MTRNIFVLNGPNLNLLGMREPQIYGHQTLADVERICRDEAARYEASVTFKQTNSESQLIDWIHEARTAAAAIVINPAGFTHTSVALADALTMCTQPIVEVHISNIHRREAFRSHSYVSRVSSGVICGLGVTGYALALRFVCERLAAEVQS